MVTMKLVDSYRNVTSSISSTVSSSMADQWVTVANVGADKGSNPRAKTLPLVAEMAAGADSIDDMDLLRRGGMRLGSVRRISIHAVAGCCCRLDRLAALPCLITVSTKQPATPRSAG